MASTLNCSCQPVPSEEYDDYETNFSKSTAADSLSTTSSSEASEVLNTSYKRSSPLFRAIERENWEGVLMFLNTGKWSNSVFSSSSAQMRSPAPPLQAKTWVTSYDHNGEAEWSQLPLHAAISYSAPFVVIQKLVELYPKAVQCTDNEGMLPIHLAYGFGAQDNVLALLLEAFPTSINEKGLGGRYPYECCELGPNKVRGKAFKIMDEQITKRVNSEFESDWKKFVVAAQESVGLPKKTDLSNKTLHDVLLELMNDRKELQEFKQSSSNRSKRGSVSGKSPKSPKSPSSPSGRRTNWTSNSKKYNV